MTNDTYGEWMTAVFDFWSLGAEAGAVMSMRLSRIAAGGTGASEEAGLMITEKIRAAIELQGKLMTGALGTTALSGTQGLLEHYRGKVAANDIRLCRPN